MKLIVIEAATTHGTMHPNARKDDIYQNQMQFAHRRPLQIDVLFDGLQVACIVTRSFDQFDNDNNELNH